MVLFTALKNCVAVVKEKAFRKKERGLCCNYGTSRFSAVREFSEVVEKYQL